MTTFRGWTRPGPVPPGGVEVDDGETLDYLSGNYRIFQAEGGHRFSTDDLLVAWWGTSLAPRVTRVADLGSGIGSVALMAAWRLPAVRVVTLEAQAFSKRLAGKSVRYDGLDDRFRLLLGDLRDPDAFAGEEPFDLVFGAPPYFPPGTVSEARHPQAVPARIEIRGTVADYAAAAARLLAPGGLFAFVFPAGDRERAERALLANGLAVIRRRDVVFREGEPVRLSLYAAMRAADLPEGAAAALPPPETPLVIRRIDGTHHPEYAAVRLTMGFPPGDL